MHQAHGFRKSGMISDGGEFGVVAVEEGVAAVQTRWTGLDYFELGWQLPLPRWFSWPLIQCSCVKYSKPLTDGRGGA